MFRSLTIRGPSASIVAGGYRTAAALRGWTVARSGKRGAYVWRLTATLERADPFHIRQTGLKLAAPRQGGFFYWPILEVPTITNRTITARLGPPER